MTLSLDSLRKRLATGDRPLRFLVAGGVNTVFGLAIYPLLLWSNEWLDEHYMIALLIAQALSVVFAFTTYRFGVFRSKGDMARQFGTFTSYYVFNYLANWVTLPLLVEFGEIEPWLAQLGLTILLIIGSYFWHSNVTFPEHKS